MGRTVMAMPVRGISQPTVSCLLNLTKERNVNILFQEGDAMLARARARLVYRFLTEEPDDADVLLFCDSDTTFTNIAVADVAKHVRETGGIVACALPTKATMHGHPQWANFRTLPDQEPIMFGEEGGLVEVEVVGTAFMGIHRNLLYDLTSKDELYGQGAGIPFWPIFDTVKLDHMGDEGHPWREWRGEDYSFCYRAREASYKIYILTNHQLGHMGVYEYKISPGEYLPGGPKEEGDEASHES